MGSTFEYVKNRFKATTEEYEQKMKGPYNDAQIEYVYGIATAITSRYNNDRSVIQSDLEDNIYDIVVRLLLGKREVINHVVNRIRAQIMLRAGDDYKKVIECMHQIISGTKLLTTENYGEFNKLELIEVGIENGLSAEQIEKVFENMLNHEDIVQISEEKYKRSW